MLKCKGIISNFYFILQKEDFWKLIELASKKDKGFDLYWLAVALEKVEDFPEDINKLPVEMIVELDVVELKRSFNKLAIEIIKKIKER